jgi:ribonuclease HII
VGWPCCSAAAVFSGEKLSSELREGLDDSKVLPRRRREYLFAVLENTAAVDFGIGLASVEEIDRHNILQATMLAMARAVKALPHLPEFSLIDGNRAPALLCPCRCIVGGDGRSLSIAAASIIAKVTRDRMMAELDATHPGYGWSHNAGYGTPEHRRALESLGVTQHHRRSFAPIHNILRLGNA